MFWNYNNLLNTEKYENHVKLLQNHEPFLQKKKSCARYWNYDSNLIQVLRT